MTMNGESIQPLHMAQLYPDEVEEKNQLYSGVTSIPVSLANVEWTFSLESRIQNTHWQCRIYADWGSAEVMLFLDQPPPIGFGIAGLDALRAERLPAELLAAVGETVLEPALDTLERISGMQIAISSILMEPVEADEAEEFIPFTLTHPEGRIVRGALVFAGDADVARETFIAILKQGYEASPEWIDAIPFPLNVEVGSVHLPIRELVNLELQDIILLDSCPLHDNSLLLRADNSGLVFKTTMDGTTLTVQERVMTMNTDEVQPDMPTEDSGMGAAVSPTDI
ncbi:MAG: FliM/FliN family flagellar motor switch protein, partial [Spirochaetales bacterium]|nr:FliM/FliN family flagellar motor switch protein [Spirochaetales bacterium]